MTDHTSHHIFKSTVLPLCYTILAWSPRHGVLRNDTALHQIFGEWPWMLFIGSIISTIIFTSTVRSDSLYFLAKLVLNFSFKILEHIQWLRLLMNQMKIAIAWVIVNESDKILLSIPRRSRKWTTNVRMYQFQDVTTPIGIIFPHICLFTLNALYTDLKVWEIKWIKNFFWHRPLNSLIWNMTQTSVS